MKKSDLIKLLIDDISKSGDNHIKFYLNGNELMGISIYNDKITFDCCFDDSDDESENS